MSKSDEPFSFTPKIIFRLLLFFAIYLLINYFFINSQFKLPPPVNKYSQNLGAGIASGAQSTLTKYASSSSAVSYLNQFLSEFSLNKSLQKPITEIKSFIDVQIKKYQRQLIDKIYQDLTSPNP